MNNISVIATIKEEAKLTFTRGCKDLQKLKKYKANKQNKYKINVVAKIDFEKLKLTQK